MAKKFLTSDLIQASEKPQCHSVRGCLCQLLLSLPACLLPTAVISTRRPGFVWFTGLMAEGSQGRASSSTEGGAMEEHCLPACSQAHSQQLSLTPRTPGSGEALPMVGWGVPHEPHQSREFPKDTLTGQLDGDISSIDSPSPRRH